MDAQEIAIRTSLTILHAELGRKMEELSRLTTCKRKLDSQHQHLKSNTHLCEKPVLSLRTWHGKQANDFKRIQKEDIRTAYKELSHRQFQQILDDLTIKIRQLEHDIHGLKHRAGTLDAQLRGLKS